MVFKNLSDFPVTSGCCLGCWQTATRPHPFPVCVVWTESPSSIPDSGDSFILYFICINLSALFKEPVFSWIDFLHWFSAFNTIDFYSYFCISSFCFLLIYFSYLITVDIRALSWDLASFLLLTWRALIFPLILIPLSPSDIDMLYFN